MAMMQMKVMKIMMMMRMQVMVMMLRMVMMVMVVMTMMMVMMTMMTMMMMMMMWKAQDSDGDSDDDDNYDMRWMKMLMLADDDINDDDANDADDDDGDDDGDENDDDDDDDDEVDEDDGDDEDDDEDDDDNGSGARAGAGAGSGAGRSVVLSTANNPCWVGLRSLCCFVLFQLEAKHEDLLLCKRKRRRHVGSKGPRVLYNELGDSLGLGEPSVLQKKGETSNNGASQVGWAFGACVVTCCISFKLSTKYFDLLSYCVSAEGEDMLKAKGPGVDLAFSEQDGEEQLLLCLSMYLQCARLFLKGKRHQRHLVANELAALICLQLKAVQIHLAASLHEQNAATAGQDCCFGTSTQPPVDHQMNMQESFDWAAVPTDGPESLANALVDATGRQKGWGEQQAELPSEQLRQRASRRCAHAGLDGLCT
eukprot:s8391_g2.t1